MTSRKHQPGGETDPPVDNTDIIQFLDELGVGKQESLAALIPQVYKELKRLAHYYMQKEGANQTFQTTALVHEAYIRLRELTDWKDRAHFFAIAARIMRHILVDYARGKGRAKRGGQIEKISLDEGEVCVIPLTPSQSTKLVKLDEALTRLSRLSTRQSKIIELRFFVGMNLDETAQVLGISVSTVKLDWQLARAWLYTEINREIGSQ